ncbi:MAG: PD-(D/E)XK nuclease family protein, partial [Sandaracinobacteroides sp.]
RSVREGSAPAVASRFWQRLLAATGTLADAGDLAPKRAELLAAARSLDLPEFERRYPRPEPAPPATARPRTISVTEVAMLKADPFAFYAKRMLALKPLDARDAEPTAGERGQAVHDILKCWLQERPAELHPLVDRELGALLERPELVALWRPRVLRMVEWAIDEIEAGTGWVPLKWEEDGKLDCAGVLLKGRVDRIDGNGSALRILDYKTGAVPAGRDVAELYETQLALLAAMARQGQFHLPAIQPVERLDYLKLIGGRTPGEERPALGKKADADAVGQHIDLAFQDFQALVQGWLLGDRPFRAKQHMVHGRRFRDFDHLARVAEWLGRRPDQP